MFAAKARKRTTAIEHKRAKLICNSVVARKEKQAENHNHQFFFLSFFGGVGIGDLGWQKFQRQ